MPCCESVLLGVKASRDPKTAQVLQKGFKKSQMEKWQVLRAIVTLWSASDAILTRSALAVEL